MFDLEDRFKSLQNKLDSNTDPQKLKEQRDLLIDLRQKVTMYERELKLVTEQSNAEIDHLTKQVDNYQRKEQDSKLNEHIKQETEASH